jgi:hypothetical protein
MVHYTQDSDIEHFIEEDVPFSDLATNLLDVGGKRGRIVHSTCEEATVCCTEEAARLLKRLGGEVTLMLRSRTLAPAVQRVFGGSWRPTAPIGAFGDDPGFQATYGLHGRP